MQQDASVSAFERRKRAVFEAVLALSNAERSGFLANLARTEPGLADSVRRLLTASHSESDGVLNRPVYERNQHASPTAIGKYEVVRHLGNGGMGSVYLCKNPETSIPVAVKIIRSNLHSRTVREHFERERDILKRLQHPNVCRLLDASIAEGGAPFIVMEWIDGEHLGVYCNRKSASLEQRLLLFSQVLAGVEYFHNCNIIHRDLKPSNLFVTPAGNVKILDFGLAKMIDHEKGRTGLGPTRTSSRFMTVAYASPEQLTGRLSGRSSDIYTLGVICYELLTGHHPFSSTSRETPQLHFRAISSQTPLRPSQRMLGLSSSIDHLVLNALQVQPQDRYDSAATFLHDLRKCLEGKPLASRIASGPFRAST
jgi:serine/threonine-protein kinase